MIDEYNRNSLSLTVVYKHQDNGNTSKYNIKTTFVRNLKSLHQPLFNSNSETEETFETFLKEVQLFTGGRDCCYLPTTSLFSHNTADFCTKTTRIPHLSDMSLDKTVVPKIFLQTEDWESVVSCKMILVLYCVICWRAESWFYQLIVFEIITFNSIKMMIMIVKVLY